MSPRTAASLAGAGTDVAPGTAELAASLRTEVHALAARLREPARAGGITPTRLSALAALAGAAEGLRAGDLAGRMGVTAPTTTRLVDVLVEEGWVRRDRDPDDARATRLSLTRHGHDTLESVRRESANRLAEDLARLGPGDRETLTRAVPLLHALLVD